MEEGEETFWFELIIEAKRKRRAKAFRSAKNKINMEKRKNGK